jgi:hypothetical protein
LLLLILGDLLPLEQLTKLKLLSLIDNPLTTSKHYKPFLIHKIPSIAVYHINTRSSISKK